MAHHFDCQSFGRLLNDAQNLRSLASTLEHKLALLASTEDASTSGHAHASISAELAAAYGAAHQQAQVADAMLRRLTEPPAADAPPRPVVLVVDDSMETREATSSLLEQAGFGVVTAADGVEALIVAHYARPVLALLDLMMPILDGLQTARLLNESPCTRHMKVVAYSGRADMFNRRLPGTFSAILAKPTTPEELLAIVREQSGVLHGGPGPQPV